MRLQKNHGEVIKAKGLSNSVKRGKQFDNYGQGSMYCFGFRDAVGGLPGDSYTMYKDMTADTVAGLNALFHHAEVSQVVLMDDGL